MTEEKPCLSCKEKINTNSIKCKHCGEFQNWKRHIHFSALILSLLVALFSTLSITIPIINNTFWVEKANLQLAIISIDHQNFDFLISNLGTRPAVITKISIDQKDNKSSDYLYPKILGKIIEPNKTYKVDTKITKGQLIPEATHPILLALTNPKIWNTCYLTIDLIHFDGSFEIQRLPFKCRFAN